MPPSPSLIIPHHILPPHSHHLVTLTRLCLIPSSPCHLVTSSPCPLIPLSPCHLDTLSPLHSYHLNTMSSYHPITLTSLSLSHPCPHLTLVLVLSSFSLQPLPLSSPYPPKYSLSWTLYSSLSGPCPLDLYLDPCISPVLFLTFLSLL